MMNEAVRAKPDEPHFTGAAGNRLAASHFRAIGPRKNRTALLLHGGGQTRHAWAATCRRLAAAGFDAIAADQRGHGDSDWIAAGAYALADYAADATALADAIAARDGERPIAIGASLGGLASLAALYKDQQVFAGLVLVDVTPRLNRDGVQHVQGFMRTHAREGFASVAEASDAVARYLPHRPRPKSLAGLAKNLRLKDNGRFYWHWDPRVIDEPRKEAMNSDERAKVLAIAAQSLKIPTLLVRGGESELVGAAEERNFRELCPQAEIALVGKARHMVAGDQNDAFGAAILGFLARRFGG